MLWDRGNQENRINHILLLGLQRDGCFFLGSWDRTSLGDYQSPGGGRDKFSGFCFPALCLSPPVPNVFILFLLLPMAFSSCLWTWGFCGLKMEMQTLAQKGRKGCFATQQGEGWGLLHKAEAILEQLPVAWKHLCDSVHWERQCKYLFKYGYYISHHLILQFLFTKPKEV